MIETLPLSRGFGCQFFDPFLSLGSFPRTLLPGENEQTQASQLWK
jgi:hypothetical protein